MAPSQPATSTGPRSTDELGASVLDPGAMCLLPAGVGPSATSLCARPPFSGPSETLRKVIVTGESWGDGGQLFAGFH